MLAAGMITGLIVAAGLVTALHALTRPAPRLADAIGRLDPQQSAPQGPRTPPGRGTKARLGRAAERALAGRFGFSTPQTDLALIGRDQHWYWAEKASSALAGFVIPIFLGGLNVLMGSPLPNMLPAFASFAGAAYFWFLPDAQVKKQAAAARADFARAAVSYLQQMAIKRRAGAGATASMRDAAHISDAWMFVRIREEISRATLAGIPVWDGLSRLGDRTGILELREVGDIMRLAGIPGAGVHEALLARARGMRDKILAEEHSNAAGRTTTMNLPIIALVTLFAFAAALPAVVALLGA